MCVNHQPESDILLTMGQRNPPPTRIVTVMTGHLGTYSA